jgi:hypothetical protein
LSGDMLGQLKAECRAGAVDLLAGNLERERMK